MRSNCYDVYTNIVADYVLRNSPLRVSDDEHCAFDRSAQRQVGVQQSSVQGYRA
jgi:hypothetical protein